MRAGARHTILATLLDVVVIVSVAVAIVLALGARPWLYILRTWVVLPEPHRLLVFAAVAAALRYWIGKDLPILPSLPVEDIRPGVDALRGRFAQPPAGGPAVKYYAAAAALASLVWVTPHIMRVRHVPDVGDPVFSSWRLARFAHQLLNEPTRLFDGNIFHPARDTLTYSDPTVLEALVALPFMSAGVDPLIVSNAVFLASFPLSALAFFYAAWWLTGDPRPAFIAGLLGGLSAFKVEHYSHLELQFFCFAPLAVVTLMRLLAAPSWRTGVVFGAVLAGQWLACMYFGVMQFVFLAPIVLLIAAGWRVRPTWKLATAVSASTAILLLGGSIIAVPFMRSQADRGERSLQAVNAGSAVPADYVAAHQRLVTYRGVLPDERNVSERELYPGAVTLALACVGALPPMSLGTIALVAATAAAFDGSLGLNGLVYDDLYRNVLPFRGMRVPARFAAFVGSGLILLAGYGAARVLMLARTRRSQAVILTALAAAAIIDLRAGLHLEPFFSTVPPVYSQITSDMVLAELPMEPVPNFAYMYFSTRHNARLINGVSGYSPADYGALEEQMQHFPNNDLLEELQERGATHITVNCRMFTEPWKCAAMVEAMDELPQIERVSTTMWEGFEVRLYRLRSLRQSLIR